MKTPRTLAVLLAVPFLFAARADALEVKDFADYAFLSQYKAVEVGRVSDRTMDKVGDGILEECHNALFDSIKAATRERGIPVYKQGDVPAELGNMVLKLEPRLIRYEGGLFGLGLMGDDVEGSGVTFFVRFLDKRAEDDSWDLGSVKISRGGSNKKKNLQASADAFAAIVNKKMMDEKGVAIVPVPAKYLPAQAVAAVGLAKEDVAKLVSEAVKTATAKPAEAKKPAITSDVDSPKYAAAENPNNFAIVVGVEKYQGLPDATFAERDAAAMREHLVALGYPMRNIAFLTGHQASKAGLSKNIETWLPNNVNEKSTVFFYYSGHGAPDPKTELAYMVPVDGDPEYLEDTAYPVKRLYEKLNALKAKRVLVAMDSCFSGAGGRSLLAKGTRPLVNKVDLGAVGDGKIISFSASDGTQISGTAEDQGHGLFTYYFLRGLNGAAKDDDGGGVTVKSLYDYVVPNVQDSAKRSNRNQTPQIMPPTFDKTGSLKLR